MKLQVLSVAQLRERLGDDAFWQRDPLPITRVRAVAQVANPRAHDDDAALVIAEEGQRVVGYLGALPDEIHAGGAPRRLSWTTSWWVDPERRQTGAGALLLFRLLKECNQAVGVSSYSVRAGRLLESNPAFIPLRDSRGLRIYCAGRPADLPRRIKQSAPTARLAGLALPAANAVARRRLRAWLDRQPETAAVGVEYVNSIDPATAALIDEHNRDDLVRRGPRELTWILQHPWYLEGPLPDAATSRYHFRGTCEQFGMRGVKVFGRDGALIGFLLLTLRDGTLTVPYCFCAEADAGAMLTVVVRHALAERVFILELYEDELQLAARSRSLRGLAERDVRRRSVISRRMADIDLSRWRLRAGDGDRAFY